MMVVDPGAQLGGIGRQILEPDAKFLGLLDFALPAVVGSDGAVDLAAGRQMGFHGAPGQPVGVLSLGGGSPGHKHGRNIAAKRSSRQPKPREK